MDNYIGEIHLFPYNKVPLGWMLCNGDLLQIAQNSALYSLIANKFGGDGQKTFALPNLLNDTPVAGMNYYIATTGYYPSRD